MLLLLLLLMPKFMFMFFKIFLVPRVAVAAAAVIVVVAVVASAESSGNVVVVVAAAATAAAASVFLLLLPFLLLLLLSQPSPHLNARVRLPEVRPHQPLRPGEGVEEELLRGVVLVDRSTVVLAQEGEEAGALVLPDGGGAVGLNQNLTTINSFPINI